MSIAEQVRRIRKGRFATVKASANVAKVTAHRVLGKGKYAVETISPEQTKVRRLG